MMRLLGTLITSFLTIFGLGWLTLNFLPVVLSQWNQAEIQGFLPLSEERGEEFLDIASLPAKQLFPKLSDVRQVSGGNQILIPAIAVTVPLVVSQSIADADVIKALKGGAALYPNGILPGHLGNLFISAHSSGTVFQGKYAFAFTRIGDLKPGQVVHIDFAGTRYTYKLTHSRIVKPSDDFTVRSDRPVPTITLMACWPIWRVSQRMLWHGELTNITQLAARH